MVSVSVGMRDLVNAVRADGAHSSILVVLAHLETHLHISVTRAFIVACCILHMHPILTMDIP